MPKTVLMPSPPPSSGKLFPLQFTTRHHFADCLGMSYHTLRRKLKAKNIAIPSRKLLSPEVQLLLLRELDCEYLIPRLKSNYTSDK